MKKIIFGLLVAFVALSFMGCPNTYEEYGYDIPVCYYVGDSSGWEWVEMTYDEEASKNVIEVTVEAGNSFKITPEASWAAEWNHANLDESCAELPYLTAKDDMGKQQTQFVEAGTYKISMDVDAETYTVEKL